MSHAVDGDMLLLDVPAVRRFLPVLRTATAGLATRLGFGLDAIEDLRVAVDEAAGLMMKAAAGAEDVILQCRFDVTDADLLITIGASDIGPLPDRQSFDWRVLDTLADNVGSEISQGVTTVRLTQRRPFDAM